MLIKEKTKEELTRQFLNAKKNKCLKQSEHEKIKKFFNNKMDYIGE